MKTFKVDFTKGMNVIKDKALGDDGWVTFGDNVDSRSGSLRPILGPSFVKTLTAGTKSVYAYRGKFWYSTTYRDYVSTVIGGTEHVYWSESGAKPQMSINGTQVDLGIPAPIYEPTITSSNALTPNSLILTASEGTEVQVPVLRLNRFSTEGVIQYINLIATGKGYLAKNTYSYRIAAVTDFGTMPPCSRRDIIISTDKSAVMLTWGYVIGVKSWKIFGRVGDKEVLLATVAGSQLYWQDDGSAAGTAGEAASDWDQTDPVNYCYTYVRSVNGVLDESGPSPVTSYTKPTTGRKVTRGFANDGFLDSTKSGYHSITSSVSVVSTAWSAVNVTAVTNNTTSGQIEFTTSGAHGLSTDDKVQLSGMSDATWNGSIVKVVKKSTTVFAVVGYPFPSDCTLILGYQTTPPVSPAVGDMYVVQPTGTGAWAGQDNKIATYNGTGWTFTTANLNDAYLASSGSKYTFNGTTWASSTITVSAYKGRVTISSGVIPKEGDAVYIVFPSNTNNGVTGLYKATNVTGTTFDIPLRVSASQAITSATWVDYNGYIKYWNLYRSGQGTSEWLLVKQLDPWVDSYDDALLPEFLGSAPDSFYTQDNFDIIFEPPPKGLTNLEAHDAMLFGIDGNDVRWTPTLRPNAWPAPFKYNFSSKPMALASYKSALIVLCKEAIHRIDGNTPTGLSRSLTGATDGCIAGHTVQKTPHGLIYLAKRGLMLFDGQHAQCITESRIPGRAITSPAKFASGSTVPFWWYPTLNGRLYNDLCAEDGITSGVTDAGRWAEPVSIDGLRDQLRSFVHNGKYHLYWPGQGNDYEGNTCLVVDLEAPRMPIWCQGMKVNDVCVDEVENAWAVVENDGALDTDFVFSTQAAAFTGGAAGTVYYAAGYSAGVAGAKIYTYTEATGATAVLAGSGVIGNSADGTTTGASFTDIRDLRYINGNLYALEYTTIGGARFKIRKITPAGVVTTIFNAAVASGATAINNAAQFCGDTTAANFYVADYADFAIKKITSGGVCSLFAGTVASAGNVDATGGSAKFRSPKGIDCDATCANLYVVDPSANVIRGIVVASGVVTTLAGVDQSSSVLDGVGTAARLDAADRIRRISGTEYWVCSTGSGYSLRVFESNSTYVYTAKNPIDSLATAVTGFGVNASGTLYYSSASSWRVILDKPSTQSIFLANTDIATMTSGLVAKNSATSYYTGTSVGSTPDYVINYSFAVNSGGKTIVGQSGAAGTQIYSVNDGSSTWSTLGTTSTVHGSYQAHSLSGCVTSDGVYYATVAGNGGAAQRKLVVVTISTGAVAEIDWSGSYPNAYAASTNYPVVAATSDGRVIVWVYNASWWSHVLVINPATSAIGLLATSSNQMYYSTARLSSGDILSFAGGGSNTINRINGPNYNSISSTTATNTDTRNANAYAYGAEATLNDGTILLMGGGNGTTPYADVTSYSGTTNSFTAKTPMGTARHFHRAVKLSSGKVLVIGGQSGNFDSTALSTGEVYDPALNTWTPVSNSMSAARTRPSACLMSTGDVMIIGGSDGSGGLSSVEFYNPTNNKFYSFYNLSAITYTPSVPQGSNAVSLRKLYAGPDRIPMHVRMGEKAMHVPHERKRFRDIEFHCKGTGTIRVYVDGVMVLDRKVISGVESPSKKRKISFPRGTKGYAVDIEISGDIELRGVEVNYESAGAS